MKRILEIQEDLSDISQRMGFKEKRREQASLSHQYGTCDQISEEISVLKDRRRVLEMELHGLNKKEKQSKWYKKKAKSRNDSSSSSSSGSMKQVSSSKPEDQQGLRLPPYSNSETLTSRSITFSGATAAEVAGPTNPSDSLLHALSSAIDNTVSPASPSLSTDHTVSPSPQAGTSSDSPSLGDLLSSAIDSDAYPLSPSESPLSPSVSPSPQTPVSSGSRALLNSATAGDTSSTSATLSVSEEVEDNSVLPESLEHFQRSLPSV